MRSRNRDTSASASTSQAPVIDPGTDIAGWRRRLLIRAGFEVELASSIAADCGIDLHAMIELVERGCPPSLAGRILAPLDGESNPC